MLAQRALEGEALGGADEVLDVPETGRDLLCLRHLDRGAHFAADGLGHLVRAGRVDLEDALEHRDLDPV